MITVKLFIKCDQEGIHLNSSGEPKNLNLLEKQLVEGLMKVVKEFFKQAHEQLEANARAGSLAADISGNGNGKPAGESSIIVPFQAAKEAADSQEPQS